jgi:hypothetical protein
MSRTGTLTPVLDDAHGAAWLSQLSDELGIDLATLLEALRPGVTAAVEQAMRTRERTLGSIDAIVRLLTPGIEELDPVPHAVLEQARRQAVLRTDLLSQGAFTYRALAEGRQTSEATARQFVRRARQRQLLFTVEHNGETLVPAFLMSEHFEPFESYVGATRILQSAGEDGWALWAWFSSPSSWLDGAVPAELARVDPDRVADAARRRVSNAW